MNTKQKESIWSAVFGTGPDIDEESSYEIIAVHPALLATIKNIENSKLKKGAEDSLTTSEKKGSSNKGGFAPKINPETEKAMRAYHKKVEQAKEKPETDKEIVDEEK